MTQFFDEQGPSRRDLPTEVFGEVPYVHTAPRRVRRVGRRAAVAAGSLAAGALAAGGAAFAIVGSGEDASVAVSALGAAPSQTAEVTADPATRTGDVSRSDLRAGTCVRLDADALAAVEQARADGADPAADGREVTVQLADGAVSVPVSALKVVKCTVPKAASMKTSSAKASSSAAKKPAATATSSTARTSTSKPASTTTAKPRTTTSTKPRTTTSTKPRTTTTTTKSPTPKPTTTSGS